MLSSNTLKDKLSKGGSVIGTWNTLSSPILTSLLAESGLDFQIIDLEHGPLILDKINLHISACDNLTSCTPLVRIPSNENWLALQVLDQGAKGIVVPHISSIVDAKKLVNSIKYYPEGERGFTPFSKAGGFNNNNPEYAEMANNSILSVAIIESKEGIEKLEEIVELKGIDVIYFGAYDLSQALGYPGEVGHPKVVRAIQNGVELVNKNGKAAGGFVPQSKDEVKRLLDFGMRFITYNVDSSIVYDHYKNITDWFSNNLK